MNDCDIWRHGGNVFMKVDFCVGFGGLRDVCMWEDEWEDHGNIGWIMD